MISGQGGPPGPAIVWRRSVAWTVLGLLMAISAALIWAWSPQLTLLDDEWDYAYRTATQPAAEYMIDPPPGGHLIAVPLLLYEAAFDGFGIDSYAPYRLGHIVLLLLCAALFYALARRRIGDALAVLPTAILLFLGSSWEVIATPLRSPSLIAIAAGLAMLLSLERRDLKGDIAAFAFLSLSVVSHSTSLAFAAAAAVLVLSRPDPERWRRCWIFLVPVLGYATWWVLEFDPGPSQSLGSVIAGAPVFVAKSLAVTLLSAAGIESLAHPSYGGLDVDSPSAFDVVAGAALIALLAGIVVARLRRPRPVSPFSLAIAAALVTFWVATNFAPGPEREPWASRYLYPDVLLLLLLLCELGRDFELPGKLRGGVAFAILALVAVSIAGNVHELRTEARVLNTASDNMRAGLTSLDQAPGGVPPGFVLSAALAGRFSASDVIVALPESRLDGVLAHYGSPAYSSAELSSRSQAVRVTADYVSLRAAGTRLRAAAALPRGHDQAPRRLSAFGGVWISGKLGCIELRPSGSNAIGTLSLPSGRLALAAEAGPPGEVTAGRFADGTPLAIGALQGDSKAVLNLPAGTAQEAWRVAIQAHQRVLACSV
jgi:hypothetical protein